MTAKSLFQLAVLAVCLSAVLGAIAPFSATDASRIEQLIRAQFQSSSATSDPALAHYSLAALSLLGKSDNSACNRIESALSSASGVDASHLVLAAEYAGCKVNSNAVKVALQASLDSGNIITASLAAQAVAKLAENKHAQLSNFKFDSAVSSAVGLMGNSGLFRSSEDGETSLYATGLAYQLVAIAYPALSANAKSKAESVKDKVEKVLDKGGDDPVVIAFPINPVNQSVLASTAALFKGLHLLNDAFAKIDLHTERLSDRFAAFFLESKFVSKAEDATALISSLRILANNPEAVPIIISKASADSKTVRVTNVLDKLVTKAKVSLAKVQPVLGGSASGQGALSSSDDISYSLPSSLSAGVYRLKITVEPEKQQNGPSNIRTTSAFVDHKVAGAEIAAKEATLSTSGTADGKDIDSTKASFPSAAPKTLNGDNSKYLRVKVALTSSSQPAQAFVVLTHSSGNAGTFVAQLNGQNVESAIDLGAPAVSGALWGSGEYSVEVLVADALSPKQLSWKVGTVQLTIADSAALTASKAKAKEEEDNTKEKFHTFRSEGSRPPVLISLIFAVLVVLPLAAFVYALPSFGVKLHFPESASGFLWTALFQLSILSLLVLILLYWLKLNIFQALAGLAVLGSFTVFSGNRALRASSEMSVAHQKSE